MKYRKTIVFALLLATACGVAYCSTQSVNSAESGVKLTGVKVDNTDKIDFSQNKSVFLLPDAYRQKGDGRPIKRDRRDIEKYKNL
mgnify:CR=1 FL=1